MNILADGLRAACMLLVFPLLSGEVISSFFGLYRQRTWNGCLFRYVSGTVLEWCVFQLLAVPLIMREASFSTAVTLWLVIEILLCALGVFLILRERAGEAAGRSRVRSGEGTRSRNFRQEGLEEVPARETETKREKLYLLILVAALLILILFQAGKYFFQMHIDDDDSRFVAEAVESYMKNTMLTLNPANGAYGRLRVAKRVEIYKDIVSPWPVWLALNGKVMGIHPAIAAHTILPVFLLLMSYAVYWLIGSRLFRGRRVSAALFTLFVALINLFFSGSANTQSEFTLARIWQGKAVVAAILVPAVFLAFLIAMEMRNGRCLFLFTLLDLAACLTTSSGLGILAVEIFVLVLYLLVSQRRWKQLYMLPVTVLPSLVYMLLYYRIKTTPASSGSGSGVKTSVMQTIVNQVKSSFSGNYIWILYLVAIAFIFFFVQKKRGILVYPILWMWLAVLNPLCVQILWRPILGKSWWRLFWLFLVPIVIAFAGTALVMRFERSMERIFYAAALCAIIAASGNWIYDNEKTYFEPAQNYYKLPQDVVAVADTLLQEEKPARVVADWPLAIYIREYTADVEPMYGRDTEGYIMWADQDVVDVYHRMQQEAMSGEDARVIRSMMEKGGYSYLVRLRDKDDTEVLLQNGFQQRETIGAYTVYKLG